jgi:hypothetical protein
MRKWLLGVVAAAALYVLNGMAGGPLGDFGSWMISQVMPAKEAPAPTPITLDFNDEDGCKLGRLADIARRQLDGVDLFNGADALTICDTEQLKAVRSEMPEALSRRFLGCIGWGGKEKGGLTLLRKSDAVCAEPGGKSFVCDGPNARKAPDGDLVGNATDDIKPCSTDLLQRFGFSS